MYEDAHLESDYEDKYTIQGDWDAEDKGCDWDQCDNCPNCIEEDEDVNEYLLTN